MASIAWRANSFSLLESFFCSTRAESILPFSNLRPKSKPGISQFFCSTAPQAFFRPDRRFTRPAARRYCQGWPLGHRQRRREASLMVSSTLADLGDRGLEWGGLDGMLSVAGVDVSARSTVLYAVRVSSRRTMASGFRRRYVPNAFSTDWRRKNRAVVEARPDRDSFRCFSSE